MAGIVFIKEDLVTVHTSTNKVVLGWGDPVEVLGREGGDTLVRVHGRGANPFTGKVRGKLQTQPRSVLKFSMVDVQQGDGMVIETPAGQIVLIDGGDNQLFARYLAARYRNTSADSPLAVAAIIVTHGDADHFEGLNRIRTSEEHDTARKRLFIHPRRVYHNGLVKGPSSLDDEKMFGQTAKTRDGRAVIDLFDDLTIVDSARMNRPFTRWKASLKHWAKRGPIDIRRVKFGDRQPFKFLRDEGIEVEVLGPIETSAKFRNKRRPGLPLLRQPPKTVELPLGLTDEQAARERRFSASHTVNGHSIAMRVGFGNVRLMLTGDLNQESMEILRKKVGPGDLESEIIKAPHHGSADFDMRALEAMRPVVSIISSGDESSRKEHIHPRATLMGALGKASRTRIPLVLCTELAAFFAKRGKSTDEDGKKFFGFERTSFGIIQIRTDGHRVLVFTHSGKENMKEAYRFTVDDDHRVRFAKDVKKR